MSGSQWQAALREEHDIFTAELQKPAVRASLPAFMAATKAVFNEGDRPWFQAFGFDGRLAAEIWPEGAAGIFWSIPGNLKRSAAEDIDTTPAGNHLIVEDVGGGNHYNQLICRTSAGRIQWTVRDVGPSVACTGNRVYFLRPHKKLWYNRLCSVNTTNGRDEKVEYEETDPRYNLSLLKCRGRNLFLFSENSGYSKLFSVGDGIQRLDADTIFQIPCAPGRIVLTPVGRYEYRGPGPVPALDKAAGDPEFYDPQTELLITRRHGTVNGYQRNSRIFSYPAASMMIDRAHLWSSHGPEVRVLISAPYMNTSLLKVRRSGLYRRVVAGGMRVHWREGQAKSADGTAVTYGFATKVAQPRALLVVMYGAYGIPTSPGAVRRRWGPLLEGGWAIGFAFVRGGGDNGWAWAEAGRRTDRSRSIEDAEACISTLRRRLGIEAEQTAIYGRSAGGILIGNLVNRWPTGNLFGMVYGEVPYLDVLQTTTNPDLPLTELEYDEFGDPAHRLEDLAFWVAHSPVTNVPAGGVPAIAVLCRTGLNDTQVYAYEPLKWIRALSGKTNDDNFLSIRQKTKDRPKLLGVVSGEGHFFSEATALEARAQDLAILNSWSYKI
jgi:hypothetical protein